MKMSKNDRFCAKPDPGRNLLGKFFTSRSPENVESILKNRTVHQKSGFWHLGKIRDIKNLIFKSFWMNIINKLIKMSENDGFRAKPDPGQILSGKIFPSRNSP